MRFDNERPIYIQIVQKLEVAIVSGVYKANEQLPTVRNLALEYKVNPNTMQRAFTELEKNKLVYTDRTNGRFVTDDKNLIKKIKEELATKEAKLFLKYMHSLGIDDKDIKNYLEKIREDN